MNWFSKKKYDWRKKSHTKNCWVFHNLISRMYYFAMLMQILVLKSTPNEWKIKTTKSIKSKTITIHAIYFSLYESMFKMLIVSTKLMYEGKKETKRIEQQALLVSMQKKLESYPISWIMYLYYRRHTLSILFTQTVESIQASIGEVLTDNAK